LDGSDTNEYFKEMFRCLNFKLNKNLKMKEVESNYKKLIYYCFPSVSDLKLKNNEFLYEKDFIIFLINSLLSFFYSGDNLLIDNDYLSYNKINFKISKNEEENNLNTSLNNTNNKISDINDNNNIKNPSHFILEILLDKMSYIKYGPSDIIFSFGNNKLNQTTHDGYDMLTLPRLVYKLCDIKIKKIFSGYDYNFVIDNENNVYSWGDNSSGQCGLGDKILIKSPKQLFFPELTEDDYIDNIICGNSFTYFISNNNKIFLCGFNIILKKYSYNPTLLDLGFDSNIIQIKSGEDFILFLTDKGNVYSMGFGSEGQLGIKNISNLSEYEHKKYCSKPTKILNSIKLISCGYKHSFAISYNGEILGWGKNNKGQLGLNFCEETKGGEENCNVLIPEQIEYYFEDIEIKNIICGKNFTFFQTNNNELLGCGNNDKDQLGIQDNNNKQKLVTKMCSDYIIPTEIEQFSLLKVIKISCGEEHSLAIIQDTISNLINIWCWGANNYGQLGLGSYINVSKPRPNHYLLEFINHNPIDISTGRNHSIVLLQRKDYNELNNNDTLTELIFKYSKI
jgi:alpha-tubulin suppressor-like RCC1 family protein